MYYVRIGIIADEPYELDKARSVEYDKENEMFKVEYADGGICYLPRENVSFFYMKHSDDHSDFKLVKEFKQ